jgi:hypothetical protein
MSLTDDCDGLVAVLYTLRNVYTYLLLIAAASEFKTLSTNFLLKNDAKLLSVLTVSSAFTHTYHSLPDGAKGKDETAGVRLVPQVPLAGLEGGS